MTRDSALRAGCALLAMLALCSCEQSAEFYPMPAQRPAFFDPDRWERIVQMTDGDAQQHFVADVFEPLAANWRWTGKRPLLRLNVPRLPAHASLIYHIEFALSEYNFQTEAPVNLTFLVNGHVLDHEQYTAHGLFAFDKEIPQEWISSGDTTLGAEIDRTFQLKNTGPRFGFILVALGLKRME